MERIVRMPLIDVSVCTEDIPEGSSFAAGEKMHELVKVCTYSLPVIFFKVHYSIHANTVGLFNSGFS